MRPILLALAALPLLAACAPAPVLCRLSAPDRFGEPPPARAVMMRSESSGLGCVVVSDETFFVLPQGEAVAGSLVPEGAGARLTVTGVRFLEGGGQERLTLSGLVAWPLALPATATGATATLRSAAPDGAIDERTLPVDLLRLDAAGGGRLAGRAEIAGEGVDVVDFDAPASLPPA